MYSKVVGKSGVLIVGDLHFSDIYSGRHKDYLSNCCSVLASIRNKVEELKPVALVILGDIVGLRERNVRNREALSLLCKFFKDVKKICKVYCVRGNHDFGDYPDFQFLADLGMFETSVTTDGYFDYFGEEGTQVPEVRFHIVDYGSEGRELDLAGDGASNVVLGHNNYTIQGLTNWYAQHDGVELSRLGNFTGVDMVVSGHIHNPSPEIISTSMISGGDCALFYAGCPTRPSFDENQYESCWYVYFSFSTEEKTTHYDALEFPLIPSKEIFCEGDFVEDKTEEDLEEMQRVENLKGVLEDIMQCRMTSGDLIAQVKAIPSATDKAKEVACNYLQVALDNKR